MNEQEYCELVNNLAIEINKYDMNATFTRYFIVGGIHYFVVLYKLRESNKFHFEISGAWVENAIAYKSSQLHMIECDSISNVFVELPLLINAILRELNSCD